MSDSFDVVRAGYAAWNRRDIGALVRLCTPDVVFALTGVFPGLEPEYSGHDGLARFMETLTEPWEEFLIEVLRMLDAGEDRVVCLVNFRGRGRGGITAELRFGHVFRLRDGLVARLDAYRAWEEALAAAGIADPSHP